MFLVKLRVWNRRLLLPETAQICLLNDFNLKRDLKSLRHLTTNNFQHEVFFFILSEKIESFLPRVLGKMKLMKNIILGPRMSREIPHSMTIYFILGLFIKSSVTSDYNEASVSVTHVLRIIFYLSVLFVLWPPWLWGVWRSYTVSRSIVEALQRC